MSLISGYLLRVAQRWHSKAEDEKSYADTWHSYNRGIAYQADADLKNAEGELLRRGIKILEAMPPEKRPQEYKAIRQQLIDIMHKI
jgi:hypothetical protein